MDVAAEILDELPRFMLVEAIQSAERGDEPCAVCAVLVFGDGSAALLSYVGTDQWFHLALSHLRCERSRVLATGDPLIDGMSPDVFAQAWRHVLRDRWPRAVLLSENKTIFDEVPEFEDIGSMYGGPGWTGKEFRDDGFSLVEESINQLAAPRPEKYRVVGRGDGLELRWGAVHGQSFPGIPARTWQKTAEREAEILLVYGTGLELGRSNTEHLLRPVKRGKVVAGILPYWHREGSVVHSLESKPRNTPA